MFIYWLFHVLTYWLIHVLSANTWNSFTGSLTGYGNYINQYYSLHDHKDLIIWMTWPQEFPRFITNKSFLYDFYSMKNSIGNILSNGNKTTCNNCTYVKLNKLYASSRYTVYCQTGKFCESHIADIFVSGYFRESMPYFFKNFFVCWENHLIGLFCHNQSQPISWFPLGTRTWDVWIPHTCVNTWWVWCPKTSRN
jgi:hypothetical protein